MYKVMKTKIISQFFRCLESKYQVHQEGTLQFLKYISFRGRVSDLVALQESCLTKGLHRVEGAIRVIYFPNQHHLAKTAFSKNLITKQR